MLSTEAPKKKFWVRLVPELVVPQCSLLWARGLFGGGGGVSSPTRRTPFPVCTAMLWVALPPSFYMLTGI